MAESLRPFPLVVLSDARAALYLAAGALRMLPAEHFPGARMIHDAVLRSAGEVSTALGLRHVVIAEDAELPEPGA